MIETNNILKYLKGQSTEIEVAELKEWLSQDVNNQETFDQIASIHKASEQLSDYERLDVNEEWKRMLPLLNFNQKTFSNRKTRSLFSYISAAAMFLLLLGASYFFNSAFINNQTQIESGISEVSFNLHDGSLIELAPESTISFLEKFENERKVILDGIATFDVAKDPSKPFVIYTDHSVTKVVGTKFTLNGNGKHTQIEVHEGIVTFSDKDNPNNTMTLVQGDKAELIFGEDVRKVIPVVVQEKAKPVSAPIVKETIKPTVVTPPVAKQVSVKPPVKKEEVKSPYGKTSVFRLKDVINLMEQRHGDKFKKLRKCKIADEEMTTLNINDYGLEGILEQLQLEFDLEFKPNNKCADCYELKSIKKK